jgi:peroxiredoxin
MKESWMLSALLFAVTCFCPLAAGAVPPAKPESIAITVSMQEHGRPDPTQADEAGNSLDPEFDALWKQYVSAVRDRDELRMKAARAKEAEKSPHPAVKFYKRFRDLADKDHADAQCWVLDNLYLAVSDKQEQVRICLEVFPLLIPKHADMDGVFRAIGGIRKLTDPLGDEEVVRMMQQIFDTSKNAEVRAQALACVAWIKSGKGLSTDPKQLAEARELRHQIVLAFPGTKTAKEASGYLMVDVEKDFLDAERAWVKQVSKLVAEKRPITEWPKQPIHEFEREFQPLAEAGHMMAKQWVRTLYPDYVLVEKQGPEIALTWLVANLGERYPYDYEGWIKVRLDMLRLLYTQFPNANSPWLTASLSGLIREAPLLPFPSMEATLKPLENNQDPKVRSLVLFLLTKSDLRSDDAETNRRVRARLQEIVDKYPDEDLTREAHELLEQFDKVMPGAVAQDFFVYDSARLPFKLSDYKGRVVMLVFFSFTDEECNKTIPARLELMKKLEGRPFSLLGVDVDSPHPQNYQEEAGRHGVTWRTVLVFTPKDALVQNYMVRSYPTCLVIDSEGVIRSRNAPWDETVKLVDKLVAEAAAKSPKKAEAAPPKR